MTPTLVINVVGLSASLLPHAPRLRALGVVRQLQPVLPAVTCSVQASMLTGVPPEGHGIVGNGWYFRDLGEVRFWNRSSALMQAEPVWDTARRDASITCANLFWWHNCWSSCETVVQARPIYKADGRKLPDCYTHPESLRGQLQQSLGPFPLFRFWGPMADISSSRWIADAAARCGEHALTLVYLPHLDYPLQKLGPNHPDIPGHVAAIDAVAGDLAQSFRGRVLVVSEYGIEATTGEPAIAPNVALRRAGLLAVRDEDGLSMMDAPASAAFAVADHQIAHVYVNDAGHRDTALRVLSELDGVAGVTHIDHARAGDFTLVAAPGRWFTYDWWDDPRLAPDFARTVDIHRKPGYDPRELFSDASPVAVAWKLLLRKLGQRQLLDVVPLDTTLVRGTHGRTDMPDALQPLLIGPADLVGDPVTPLPCTDVRDVILRSLLE
jgi:predicted AlkP superfamily pyrophosphatase or phosphodiesterase